VLVLSVIQGPDKGRKFQLPDDMPQLIGRSSEALPIDDTAVSRRHAELTPDDGVWYIRDLASQNGTYVNGVRISDRTRLRPGDQIRTGQTLFVFGMTSPTDPDVVRVVEPRAMDATIERSLAGSGIFEAGMDDSVILAEPEPRAAAVDHLRVIYRLTQLVSGKLGDKRELLRSVLELVFAELKPERGCVMIAGVDGVMKAAAVKYREAPLSREDAQIEVSRTILGHVMGKNEGVLSSNAMNDPRFRSGDSVQRLHIRSAICSPIRAGSRVYGAIYIDSSMANYTFTAEQLALMNAIGQHAGLALSNAELLEQTLQSERLAAIGETVATLSHAVKNILQGLRGGADVVELGLNKGDLKIARGGWTILTRNLDRIISLNMNMLAFSRHRPAEVELVKLGAIVEECAELLEAQCATRQVALIVDADSEMPPVAVDPALMHQAVMNLLTNAVEAVPAGEGVVTVRVVYREGKSLAGGGAGRMRPEAEIAVIDNGPGIAPERVPLLFVPFATTKGTKGTGLGLAVAKRIAQEHGGRVLVETAVGKGSTFRLIVPADASPAHDPSATAQQQRSTLPMQGESHTPTRPAARAEPPTPPERGEGA
jgi:signal transduction histidine kinase